MYRPELPDKDFEQVVDYYFSMANGDKRDDVLEENVSVMCTIFRSQLNADALCAQVHVTPCTRPSVPGHCANSIAPTLHRLTVSGVPCR